MYINLELLDEKVKEQAGAELCQVTSHEKIVNKLWRRLGQVMNKQLMDKLGTSHEQVIGHEQVINKQQAGSNQVMNNSRLLSHEQVMTKS